MDQAHPAIDQPVGEGDLVPADLIPPVRSPVQRDHRQIAGFPGRLGPAGYLVGGVPCSIDVDEVAAINGERLNLVAKLISDADEFVNQVYLVDVAAVAADGSRGLHVNP